MNDIIFTDYFLVVFRNTKKIIIGTIMCILLAAAVVFLLPDIYQAKSIVYVFVPELKTEFAPAEVSLNALGEEVNTGYNYRGAVEATSLSINAFSELAQSSEVLQELIERLSLKDVSTEDLDKMLKAKLLEIHSSISLRTYAPIIRLVAEAKDKKIAQELANTWGEILVNKINSISNYRFEEADKFLSEELSALNTSLTGLENSFLELKKQSGIDKIQLDLKAKEEELAAYNSRLPEAKIDPLVKPGVIQELTEKTKKEIIRLRGELEEKNLLLSQAKREIQAGKEQYELLQQKKGQFKLSHIERPFRAKVIALSALPGKHVRPMRGLAIMVAGFLGLLFMCLAVILEKIIPLKRQSA
ncbi:MAG: Wzz/FepE/Etk N-terminal domain-containing protein [Candidatus Omnitrophica bacterium]|nr:Wzz/FepE/Etk N-terminal domain-containing protein [Candidatus Omnitrophota bacterium]